MLDDSHHWKVFCFSGEAGVRAGEGPGRPAAAPHDEDNPGRGPVLYRSHRALLKY